MKTNVTNPLIAALLCAAPLDVWTWRNPLPTGNNLNSVAHGVVNGNGLFAAVGPDGSIVTSPGPPAT